MSLWTCPTHGLYGGQVFCPKCGGTGDYTTVSKVLDLKREHRMIGPIDDRGHSWAVQDDVIMTWSESNVCFEEAWWLNPDGSVRDIKRTPVVEAVLRDRPFDAEWLK